MVTKSVTALGLLVLFLGVAGCKVQNTTRVDTPVSTPGSAPARTGTVDEVEPGSGGDDFEVRQGQPTVTDDSEVPVAVKAPSAGQQTSFTGAVLAGTASPVIDFNKSDYDKALAAKKNIVLYFYANWCPICKREVPEMYSAFNELREENLVAFRVNYNDSDTDNDEVSLARQFGVPYQHTKVFLKKGERVLKSPESWDKSRYLEEIQKAF